MGILKMKSPPNCHFIFRLNQQMPTCNGMMTMTMFIVVPTSLRMVCSWGRTGQGSSSSYFRLEFAFVARNCCVLLLPSLRRAVYRRRAGVAAVLHQWSLAPAAIPSSYWLFPFAMLMLCPRDPLSGHTKRSRWCPKIKWKRGAQNVKTRPFLHFSGPAENIKTMGICPYLPIHLKETLTLFETKGKLCSKAWATPVWVMGLFIKVMGVS